MNKFQTECWHACQQTLEQLKVPFDEPIYVRGEKEDYYIIQLRYCGRIIDLYLYDNEAGIMVNKEDWIISEVPDFDTQSELITNFIANLGKAIESCNTSSVLVE